MDNMPMVKRDDLQDSKAVYENIQEYQTKRSVIALGYIAKRLLEERDALKAKLEPLPGCGHPRLFQVEDRYGADSWGHLSLLERGYCSLCRQVEERVAAAVRGAANSGDAKLS